MHDYRCAARGPHPNTSSCHEHGDSDATVQAHSNSRAARLTEELSGSTRARVFYIFYAIFIFGFLDFVLL